MGAFNAAIAVLSRITKGKEYILIILITVIIAAGGTTFGLAEETIALYLSLIHIYVPTMNFLGQGKEKIPLRQSMYTQFIAN